MSQIDKLIFMPLLSWFLFFICILYFWVFRYYLGFFFRALKIRQLFFFKLITLIISLYVFFEFVLLILLYPFIMKLINIYYINRCNILLIFKSFNFLVS